MDLSAFRIGGEFLCGTGRWRWRCTDIGTRVVVAIRVDEATIATKVAGAPVATRTITGAEAMGWFDGPLYGVVEHVFDEDDREACSPVEG